MIHTVSYIGLSLRRGKVHTSKWFYSWYAWGAWNAVIRFTLRCSMRSQVLKWLFVVKHYTSTLLRFSFNAEGNDKIVKHNAAAQRTTVQTASVMPLRTVPLFWSEVNETQSFCVHHNHTHVSRPLDPLFRLTALFYGGTCLQSDRKSHTIIKT